MYLNLFTFRYLGEQGIPNIDRGLIINGTEILSLAACTVKVKDSRCFLPLALAKLPAAFGLDAYLTKGYFPYLFDTPENRHYRGVWPEAKYYDADCFSPTKREDFFKWYEKQKEKVIKSYSNVSLSLIRSALGV